MVISLPPLSMDTVVCCLLEGAGLLLGIRGLTREWKKSFGSTFLVPGTAGGGC